MDFLPLLSLVTIKLCGLFIQVFHWSQPAGNYAFLESRDQCLHGRLGSVVLSWPVGESQ